MSSIRKILIFLFLTVAITLAHAGNSTAVRGACPPTNGKCSLSDFFESFVNSFMKFCRDNKSCKSTDTCCVDRCGFKYCQVVNQELKSCPDMTGVVGLCWEDCSDDSSCTNGKKCCFNGCGHDCQDPVIVKPGKCPPVTGDMFGICLEACQEDSICPGSQKCCSNGCGHICKIPV